MKDPFLIGITGGSGSGKTFFLSELIKRFAENEVCLLSQDNYYHPLNKQPIDKQGIENFDLPESINDKLFASDLRKLKSGQSIEIAEYTFNNPNSSPNLLQFNPAPVILVEGIFVFNFKEIDEMLDLKLFIEAREHIKLKRRIVRDNEERGYDLQDVLYRYENHVAPTYSKYIEPFKHGCDFIIPNNDAMEKALEVISVYIKSKL